MNEIILIAVSYMRKSFGGTDVILLSTDMYRTKPTEYSPIGMLGVDVEIVGIKTFLPYQFAEDMCFSPNPPSLADDFVFRIIKSGYPNLFQ